MFTFFLIFPMLLAQGGEMVPRTRPDSAISDSISESRGISRIGMISRAFHILPSEYFIFKRRPSPTKTNTLIDSAR